MFFSSLKMFKNYLTTTYGNKRISGLTVRLGIGLKKEVAVDVVGRRLIFKTKEQKIYFNVNNIIVNDCYIEYIRTSSSTYILRSI